MSIKPLFAALKDPEDATAPGNAQIWRLTGKMVGDQACFDFLESARSDIKRGKVHSILDLSRVTFANSTGVGVLASVFSAASEAGGSLILVGVNQRVRSVLTVINLWPVVTSCDTVDEAVKHLVRK